MDTLIKIITTVWPLIKEGLLGNTSVKSYLSRRKFTTAMLCGCLMMLAGLSVMVDQANYYKAKYLEANNKELILKTRIETLVTEHEQCKDTKKLFKDELFRLHNTYEIESPLIINRGVTIKD